MGHALAKKEEFVFLSRLIFNFKFSAFPSKTELAEMNMQKRIIVPKGKVSDEVVNGLAISPKPSKICVWDRQ